MYKRPCAIFVKSYLDTEYRACNGDRIIVEFVDQDQDVVVRQQVNKEGKVYLEVDHDGLSRQEVQSIERSSRYQARIKRRQRTTNDAIKKKIDEEDVSVGFFVPNQHVRPFVHVNWQQFGFNELAERNEPEQNEEEERASAERQHSSNEPEENELPESKEEERKRSDKMEADTESENEMNENRRNPRNLGAGVGINVCRRRRRGIRGIRSMRRKQAEEENFDQCDGNERKHDNHHNHNNHDNRAPSPDFAFLNDGYDDLGDNGFWDEMEEHIDLESDSNEHVKQEPFVSNEESEEMDEDQNESEQEPLSHIISNEMEESNENEQVQQEPFEADIDPFEGDIELVDVVDLTQCDVVDHVVDLTQVDVVDLTQE